MLSILLRQILLMALLMVLGYALLRRGILSETGSRELGALLIHLIIPCVILRSYLVDCTTERLRQLGQSAFLALASLGLSMLLSWLVFGRRAGVLNFASAFGNAGFMGIPLAQALFGQEAVFQIAAYVALLNFFQWTYGLFVLTGDRELVRPAAVLRNPVFLSLLVAIPLFLSPFRYPELLLNALDSIAGLNTPVAMLVLGSYLVGVDWKGVLDDKKLFLCMGMRLVIIPLATLALFRCLPVGSSQMKLSLFLACATSVGGNIVLFARQYDADHLTAIRTVCLSTALSLLTLPVLFPLAQALFPL